MLNAEDVWCRVTSASPMSKTLPATNVTTRYSNPTFTNQRDSLGIPARYL